MLHNASLLVKLLATPSESLKKWDNPWLFIHVLRNTCQMGDT